MNKKDIKKIIDVAESMGWNITHDDGDFCFSNFSPAGQDFNIEVSADTIEELANELEERYENYDCSEETYLWLDESGHGKNGAPYDMKDVYEDMESCEKMLKELSEKIKKAC